MTSTRTRFATLAASGLMAAAGATVLATPAGAAADHAVPRCGNASLSVTRTYVDGGAGHSWMSLIYRNATSKTCTVAGYPGFDATSRTGHVFTHAKRTLAGYGGGGKLRTVTVRPGGYASAVVEWLNFNGRTGGSCRFSAGATTVVPNTSRVHKVAVSVSLCGLQVHPTVAGTPGHPNFGPAQRWWIKGAKSSSAGLNYYLRKAEADLKAAKIYSTQVKQLAQLISFPETGNTPKQIKQARADVKSLDSFFGTPGLYS